MAAIFNNIKEAVLYTGRKFDRDFNLDDPQRKRIYQKAFHCLSDSPRAEEFRMNPEKGLLVQGSKGVGKTILMKVMQKLFLDTDRQFVFVRAIDILDLIRDEGFKELEIKAMYGKALKCDLCIDDIGFGPAEINRFGSYVNIIGEIIYEREELWTMEGFRTHFTTNLRTNKGDGTAPSLESMYGDRVFDRIKHFTNHIHWQGGSLR